MSHRPAGGRKKIPFGRAATTISPAMSSARVLALALLGSSSTLALAPTAAFAARSAPPAAIPARIAPRFRLGASLRCVRTRTPTIMAAASEPELSERVFATLPYLLPFLDGFPYGIYVFQNVPGGVDFAEFVLPLVVAFSSIPFSGASTNPLPPPSFSRSHTPALSPPPSLHRPLASPRPSSPVRERASDACTLRFSFCEGPLHSGRHSPLSMCLLEPLPNPSANLPRCSALHRAESLHPANLGPLALRALQHPAGDILYHTII